MAGFDVKLGVDFDDAALKTFANNHGNAVAQKLDLFNLDNVVEIKNILTKLGTEQLDVLIGGPPCQGFSLAGNRIESDERNALYTAMVKTAELLKPREFYWKMFLECLRCTKEKLNNEYLKILKIWVIP